MVQSQQVLEWMAEGEAKGALKAKQQTLLRLLAKRFPPGAPADLAAVIQMCKDSEQLFRWIDAAVDAATLEEFRQAVKL